MLKQMYYFWSIDIWHTQTIISEFVFRNCIFFFFFFTYIYFAIETENIN